MDRVRTFYRIAKENGRRLLVVKLKDCYYYHYLKYMCRRTQKLGVPNYYYYDEKDIVIYKPPKQVSGTYADGDYFTTRMRDVCKPANAKTAAEIREKTQVGTYAPSATLALQA